MRAVVYCRGDIGTQTEQLKVWEGDLPEIPIEGDYIVVFKGWCSQAVERVHYCLRPEPYVIIEIGPDISGECAAALKEENDE